MIASVSDSGWITEALFVDWLHHFKNFVKPSNDSPVLLILDNHESHISLEAYNYCRKNDIHLLTLPPHTSHRMQPLDLTFYSPLKNAYNKECESYMMNHPGQAITAFEIVGLFTKAFNRTANIEKAANDFKAAGIYPFNSGKFDELFIEPNQPTIEEPPRDLSQAETFTPRNTSIQFNIAAPDNCNIGSTSTQDDQNRSVISLRNVVGPVL
ncbi:hypothetical protein X777_14500 [Ooceraea biroi]|uniref:DDE-1 domain-containing protein n=1 Tax=Ooceraea biroi TaxID=2015173 RepID=A0A026VYJ2_OOCBI|nr:hypothetical protein X777_14500 [Ooceraea biroi]